MAVRAVAIAGDAGAVAHRPGRDRRAGRAAVADHPAQLVSTPPARHGAVDLRHGGRRGARDRPRARRLSRRGLQLALVVPHAGAARAGRLRGSAPGAAARQERRRGSSSTGPGSWRWQPPWPPCSSCSRAACGSIGSQSTEIIVECIVAALAFYIFLAHCLTSDAPFLNLRLLEGSQLFHRPGAGDDLRHAQLHAHGAAAAAAAAARRASPTPWWGR